MTLLNLEEDIKGQIGQLENIHRDMISYKLFFTV